MAIVNPKSLAATVDAINEAFFFGRKLPAAERGEAARWIAGRVGMKKGERFCAGSYRGMFAPTPEDFAGGIRLFTGERMPSRAGTAHILGQEACRAMILLDSRGAGCRTALAEAEGWMSDLRTMRGGMYCCATCSCALWRHVAVSALARADGCLAAGLKSLRAHRAGEGRWQRFPFYYTLLALTEIDLPDARRELRYAAPACRALLGHAGRGGAYDERRRELLRRAVEKASAAR